MLVLILVLILELILGLILLVSVRERLGGRRGPLVDRSSHPLPHIAVVGAGVVALVRSARGSLLGSGCPGWAPSSQASLLRL